MARVLSRVLAAAAVALLVRLVLAGSVVDLGAGAEGWAAAALALGVGAGLVSRMRLPRLCEGVALALLVPLRGPLCDLVLWIGASTPLAALLAALLTLVPLGLALGRQLRGLVASGGPDLLAGWCAGEVLATLGALSFLPGWATGLALAGLLAGLDEVVGPHRRHEEGRAPARMTAAALPTGLALGLLMVCLRRLVPAYVDPPPYGDVDVRLALLLGALVVALPASVLARSGKVAPPLAALGALALALAVLHGADNLGLYRSGAHVQLGWRLHDLALSSHGWLSDWRAWLLAFSGYGAAALGLVLGALPGVGAGPLALGLGLALAAEELVLLAPVWGPAGLLLLASGAALVAAPMAWFGLRGLWALPLLALPFVLRPLAQQPGFDELRRPGEIAVDGFRRGRRADVTLFAAPGPGGPSSDGRRAHRRAFAGLSPPRPPGTAPPAPGSAPRTVARVEGLSIGGVALHAGHPPTGPEGSVSRLTRLFVAPGRALVLGPGSVLLAADLRQADLVSEVGAATDLGLDEGARDHLLRAAGLPVWEGTLWEHPALRLRADPGGLGTVILAPGRVAWPGTAGLLARETLQRVQDRLAPAGRCLAWVDSTDLDQRALRSRLAAFASVFEGRSTAFLEMRGLDPPLLLLLGWATPAGRPARAGLEARLPLPWRTGLRSRLADVSDLAGLLLVDPQGMDRLAQRGPVHRRRAPIEPRRGAAAGWAAVRELVDPGARLAGVLGSGPPAGPDLTPDLAEGLTIHASYSYHVQDVNQNVVEIVGDVDWTRFDQELAAYVAAARANAANPLLHLALASLLEPLVAMGDYTRFSEVYEATGAAGMASWRLSAQEAAVAAASLQPERARQAWQRARDIAGGGP